MIINFNGFLYYTYDHNIYRCSRLGICSLSYLWRRDQKELLQEMIDCNIEAIVIKVAALGLDPTKHLGLRIDKLMPHLVKMVIKEILTIIYTL